MPNFAVKSVHYRDHDDCAPYGQGHESEVKFEDGTTAPIWRCDCGGWYYLPSVDEVYDL